MINKSYKTLALILMVIAVLLPAIVTAQDGPVLRLEPFDFYDALDIVEAEYPDDFAIEFELTGGQYVFVLISGTQVSIDPDDESLTVIIVGSDDDDDSMTATEEPADDMLDDMMDDDDDDGSSATEEPADGDDDDGSSATEEPGGGMLDDMMDGDDDDDMAATQEPGGDDNDDDTSATQEPGDDDDVDVLVNIDITVITTPMRQAAENAERIYPVLTIIAISLDFDSVTTLIFWQVDFDDDLSVLVAAVGGQVLDFGSTGSVTVINVIAPPAADNNQGGGDDDDDDDGDDDDGGGNRGRGGGGGGDGDDDDDDD